jgi:periplasmic divalent cation tolerance protein
MRNELAHSDHVLVMTTLPDEASARVLARHLVERRLAACVSISPAVQSIYRWQGAIEEANEVMLLINTTRSRYDELEVAIRHAHPYEVPEIIAVPVTAGLPAYLGWIEQQTTKDGDV